MRRLGYGFWSKVTEHRLVRALLLLYEHLEAHDAPTAASAMAFDAFLSFIPLAAFAGYVLYRLDQTGDIVLGPLLRATPRPVAEIVASAVSRFLTGRTQAIAPISIVGFVWTSSAGLSTAMYVFETMFHSPKRPFVLRRGIAILLVLGSVAVIAGVTGLAIAASLLSSILGSIVAVTVPGGMLFGMLVVFFRVAVRRGPVFQRRRVMPGVTLTVVLWTVLSALFSLYVGKLARYATLYGSLAAVAIFLFWLWLLALALLVGGELNAQLDGVRDDPSLSRRRAAPPRATPGPQAPITGAPPAP